MRKINIFLGSSINELVFERQAFADTLLLLKNVTKSVMRSVTLYEDFSMQ